MQGPTVKTYFAQKMGIDPRKIVNVCVTPCTAKKFEIRREEMCDASKRLNIPGMRDMDHVITTRELAMWAKENGIDFKALEDSDYDDYMGQSSGAGAIFANSGGVMEAAVRTAYELMTGVRPPDQLYHLKSVRGLDGIKEATLTIGNNTVSLAVIYGTANVRQFLEQQKQTQKHYDFVEVMACPGGCIGGGGQPKSALLDGQPAIEKRNEGIYNRDSQMQLRNSHDNPQIKKLYDSFYIQPLSPLAEDMLHTTYHDRSQEPTKN
jgi:ferredoxin hydrogenase